MSQQQQQGKAMQQHPLVRLMFWALGQDPLPNGCETSLPTEGEEAGADGLKERTLSWKDEKQGAPLTTTNTWIDDFGEVEGQDVPLKGSSSSALKPKALLNRESRNSGSGSDPGSPNWGFFVSITPPQADLFAKLREGSGPTEAAVAGGGGGGGGAPSTSATGGPAPPLAAARS